METTILTYVGSLGFPIVACIWLAVTFKKSIDANTASNKTLSDLMIKICAKLGIEE